MEISIVEAAARLGKSDRQIRYMIANQEIAARKVKNKWVIQSETLPLSPGQAKAEEHKEQILIQRTEMAVGAEHAAKVLGPPDEKRAYSVSSLRAFPICMDLYKELRQTMDEGDPVLVHLREALEHLAIGCHRFHKANKSEAYFSARDSLCRAVVCLLASAPPIHVLAVERLEQQAIPAVSNLMSRLERKWKS